MREQVAAHQVETCIPKGKRERIPDHRPASVAQMGRGAIQQGDLQAQSAALQSLAGNLGDVSRSSGDFQQRQRRRTGLSLRHAPDHVFGGGDAPKPAIDSPQIAERGGDFGGRARVSVKQFGE